MSEEYRVISFSSEKVDWHIFPGLCKGCGLCIERCPVDIIYWSEELGVYATPIVENRDIDKCTGCGMCALVCPEPAIVVKKKPSKQKEIKGKED
jgi:2-oxoglutarate ferredoxin oxidoreductase subunit delta